MMEYAVKYYAINSDLQTRHRTDQMALPQQIQLWMKYHDYYGAALLPWLFLGGTALLMVITIRRARQSPEFFWLRCMLHPACWHSPVYRQGTRPKIR